MLPDHASEAPHERHAEFVAVLTATHGKLMGYLMSLLGRRQDAEDVLQRASVLMWQKFATFEPGTDFMAWASTICFYEAKNFIRLAARSPVYFDDDLLATLGSERLEDLPARESRIQALETCLGKLGREDQQLIRAAYLDSSARGITELAVKMNRAPQTLYNKLNHLRRMLAECVQRQLQEEHA
ncbi:RNA polymerase sigma-70 factor (ECF subfamily) [Prosthecobacter fusiformis]|uniref:RNA polymerase sigma-70 factor (ECF subfamily) n=1 Tax=Prosthecobacter fusiformis TaxID=48464 RepID=A0A4R7SUC9_9BACT|nr:sigma-70 family RNA polymerase sigma factor [Prosthecobacter fusiformis]TDU81898.1 RNA polymerase sigma-70 factor (ECF subfamily) [Prosthecobacter fusiformis]